MQALLTQCCRKLCEQAFATGGEVDLDDAPIMLISVLPAPHQPTRFRAIHQPDDRIVADLQTFRNLADAGPLAAGHALDRKQDLVLLWGHAQSAYGHLR